MNPASDAPWRDGDVSVGENIEFIPLIDKVYVNEIPIDFNKLPAFK